MQVNVDEIVYMKLEGVMIETMENIDPNLYKKYTVTNNGKRLLYIQP